jgi:Photoprotection regulator fluorescence recovery protein
MSSPSATPNTYPYQNEPMWSKSEKAIARTAFDSALKRELQEVMRKTEQMANQIKEPADVWELEHYLTERRKEINRKYDYRYSQLTHVFGRLLHEGRVSEEELRGLREDKLKPIRSFAKFLAEDTAA